MSTVLFRGNDRNSFNHVALEEAGRKDIIQAWAIVTAGAAIGAPFAGHIYDVTGGYSIAFLIGGIVLTVGSVLSFIVNPPKKPYLK